MQLNINVNSPVGRLTSFTGTALPRTAPVSNLHAGKMVLRRVQKERQYEQHPECCRLWMLVSSVVCVHLIYDHCFQIIKFRSNQCGRSADRPGFYYIKFQKKKK